MRVLRLHADVVTLGFLQKETSQRVNRIGDRTGFDLGCDIFKCRCLRKKMKIELWQRRWSSRLAASRKIARASPIFAIRHSAFVARCPIAPAAVFFSATRATGWMIMSPLTTTRPGFLIVFPLRMPRRRPILLHPCGKELQINQIKRFAGRWHTSHVLHQLEK